MENKTTYFSFLNVTPQIIDNPRLREPQRDAYAAVFRHFQSSCSPALIQIPVGGGKTGLISILPFGIAGRRVLIVAPNLTIRNSIFSAVDSANPRCFWNSCLVAKPTPLGPFAAVIDGSGANFSDCFESHFVVTNVQQIGVANNRWLPLMPPDFFDMILLDEGHHNAANSWQRLMAHFPNAKIVSLTATPFRSDGQELTGEPIYRCSYRKAMSRGYIKTLRAQQITPCELSFTFRDSTEKVTLQQVLQLREESWFSRGVALADQCNRNIVCESIAACESLRKEGARIQQIIAVACSVDHAEGVAELYRLAGYKAMEIHSKQTNATKSFVLSQLISGKIDTIVQVQMLGEGFDHPPLSVAAILRPFRSLSPFIQFVGRVMRVIHQDSPGHIDNRGVVVSHVGLNTERLWNQFRGLDKDDQILWASIIRGADSVPEQANSPSQIADDLCLDFLEDLPQPHMSVEYEKLHESSSSNYAIVPIRPEHKPTASEIPQVGSTDESPLTVVGPQQRRRTSKSQLSQQVDQSIRYFLGKSRLHPMGRQLSAIHPMLRHHKNWTAARFWVFYKLNRQIGRDSRSNKDWSLKEIEQALSLLPSVIQELALKLHSQGGRRF